VAYNVSNYSSSVLIVILVFAVLFLMLYFTQLTFTVVAKDNLQCLPIAKMEKRFSYDFLTPTYLPSEYEYKCGAASTGEADVFYWDKPIDSNNFNENIEDFVQQNGGSILLKMTRYTDIKNGTQATIEQYNHIRNSSAIKPELIDINGKLAWENEIGGIPAPSQEHLQKLVKQTTNSTNGVIPARLRFYTADNAFLVRVEGYVPLEELEKIAKSLH